MAFLRQVLGLCWFVVRMCDAGCLHRCTAMYEKWKASRFTVDFNKSLIIGDEVR